MKSCCSHAPLYRDAAGSLDQYGQEYVHGADEGKNGEAVVSDGFSGSNYSVSQAQIVFQNCFEAALDAYTSLPGVKVPRNLQPKKHYTYHREMVVIGIREAFTATFLGAGGCPSAIIAADENGIYSFSAAIRPPRTDFRVSILSTPVFRRRLQLAAAAERMFPAWTS